MASYDDQQRLCGGGQMRQPRGPQPVSIELTERLHTILEEMVRSRRRPHDEVQRASIILQSAAGARNRHIAAVLGISDVTVRLWRTRWAKAAAQVAVVEGEAPEETVRDLIQQVLSDAPRGGRPATFTPEQICQIIVLAGEAPEDSGRPVSHWTPWELADEAMTRGIVSSISTRSIGRFLKRGGPQTPSVPLLAQSPARRGSGAIRRRRPDYL
jgi:transposase